MGYYKHHSIIVTVSYKDAKKVWKKAMEIFPKNMVSPIMTPECNLDMFIYIAPDGAKESSDDSDIGNDNRNEFMYWLDSNKNNISVSYVEVVNFDENGRPRVTRERR